MAFDSDGNEADRHRIASDRLAVTVLARGAEPISIAHAAAGEVLWQAGPAWPKHAPVLFPIVGELANGRYRYAGRTYALSRHGFARERDFAWRERETASCTLVLEDDDATRAVYPFRFALEIRYAIENETLAVAYTLRNPGDAMLHASLGAHPAFRWPLPGATARDAHVLTFAHDEPEPIRRLRDNLLDPQPYPTPIDGRTLALDHALFDADAIVMDRPRSTSVSYAAPHAPRAPAIDVAWTGFAQLGIWSKRGGDFVCIEPWYGYASPADFAGDFADKPGLAHVAPGDSASFAMRVRVAPPA